MFMPPTQVERESGESENVCNYLCEVRQKIPRREWWPVQMVMAMMVLAYSGVMGRYQGSECRRKEGGGDLQER